MLRMNGHDGAVRRANDLVSHAAQHRAPHHHQGLPERVRTRMYDTPHEFNAAMQAEAWDWLKKWLA